MATQVGALANIGLAGCKVRQSPPNPPPLPLPRLMSSVVYLSCQGLIGYGVHSTALMADAANSLGDLLIDAVVFYTIREGTTYPLLPPDALRS